MELPKRKHNRLSGYDYSLPNVYFLTACTEQRKNLFWENVGATIGRPQDLQLSPWGIIVQDSILHIPRVYPSVTVVHYVIMPNHIHLLLQINADNDGRSIITPTVSVIMQQMKGAVTKRIGHTIWQKSFHDHIVRSEKEFRKIWEYIDSNPILWQKDCFYTE